jgi:DNA-binding protein Fis
MERRLIQGALERTDGNQTKAAKLLSISRDQLRYRLEKYDLS